MVFYKKRKFYQVRGKKSFRGRKRTRFRGKSRRGSRGRMRNNSIYFIKRSVTKICAADGQGQDIQLDANGFLSLTFKLSDLPDFAEVTNLFAKYQLFKVVVRCQFISTAVLQNSASPGGDNQQHMIQYVYSYDDADAITEASMNQFQNTKVKSLINGGRPVYMVVKPRHHDIIATSGTAAPYSTGIARRGWISSESSDVVHFGIKLVCTTLDTFTPDDNFLMRLDIKYYCGFKNVH